MSRMTDVELDGELKCAIEILVRLEKAHRIVLNWVNGAYVPTLEVGEACMKGGWLPITDVKSLIKWLEGRLD